MYYGEYETKVLEKLHRIELMMLNDFMDLCDRNNIDYFAISGSAIGTLRHKGFIPWDDDIDVAMPREDYDKLMGYIEEEYSDKYIVLNTERYPNYPLMTTRLCLKGTEFKEEALKEIDAPMGIFLDIYAYDKVSDDPKEAKKQAWDAWFWSKMLILRSIPFPMLGFTGIKKKIVHLICGIVHILMVIFRISKKWIHKKAYEATTRFNHYEKTLKWNYICDTDPYISTYNVADIFPLQKLQYEDIMMNFPGNIHANLTNMYGDYMQLPPEEKRKNHYPYALKFPEQ